jgi:SAM-dependent methyltransferase
MPHAWIPMRGPALTWVIVGACCALGFGARPVAQQPPRPPDIYFTGTPQAVVYEMLQLAQVSRSDIVYDLGSGDGRILVIAAQTYGAHGVGIEIQPQLVELSRQIAKSGAVADKVTFIEGDLFTADISAATVVTLWLSQGVNARLEAKLRGELKPGTRIVSHQFPIGRWTPDKMVRADYDQTDLYLWTVPAP